MSTAFRVILTGAQETPPNTSTASGLGTVIFNDKAVTASYSFRIEGVDFGPVTGRPPQTPATDDDVTRTHFHNQQAGVAGPIVFGQIDPTAQLRQDNDDLTIVPNPDGSWTVSGVWETTDPVNSSGLSIADFAAVLGSAPVNSAVPLYFNVHTSEFGAGEIRGQLVAIADDNDNNPTVDDLFYALGNLDVSAAGVDPDAHYANFGWREGRDPNAFFSTVGYLAANPDVKAAGINPLDHYNQFGWKEGRDPGDDFDTSFYLIHNPDVARANVNPLEHYLKFGQFEARQIFPAVGFSIPSTDFDPEFYLLSNRDVAASGMNPSDHFFTFGSKEGRDPNGLFDTSFYLSQNPDVAASGINPLLHYGQFGWKEGRDPSASFSTNGYLAANPDVKAAGVNPLDHFLRFGLYEGRLS